MLTDDQLRVIRACSRDDYAFEELLHLILSIQTAANVSSRNSPGPISPPAHPPLPSYAALPSAPEYHTDKAKYQALLKTLPDTLFHIDSQGNYLSVTGPLKDMLVASSGEAGAKNIRELLPEPLPYVFMCYITRAIQTDELQVFHYQLVLDRTRRDYEARVAAIGKQSVFLIVRDITAQQRFRAPPEPVEEASELAQHARLTSLGHLGHEIRTPLNVIMGMTGLLLDTDLTLEQREISEIIRAGGNSLRTLIDDMLDLSKIEARTLDLEHMPFDPRHCIEDAVDLVAPRATEKQLELIYAIEDSVPGTLIGDAARLRQVVVNLLSHAVKFTETGEVAVFMAGHPTSNEPPVYALEITVRDSGTGLSQDCINQLSQPSTQFSSSVKHAYADIWFGLAISKQLIELMGGRLEIQSNPGQGTMFRIVFEAEAVAEPLPEYLSRDHSVLAGKQILIIDDNSTSRMILVQRLQAWGMLVWTEQSITGALIQLEQELSFNLLLLDAGLPEMQDAALMDRLRQHCNTANIPIIVLAPLGIRRAVIEETQEKNMAVMLTRPVKMSHLFTTLVDICSGQFIPLQHHTTLHTPANEQMAQFHPLRILIVEDNPTNQRVAQLFLERLGYRADIATNGLEMLAVMKAMPHQPYDVILMDVEMPEMDGIEATHRIRADWPPHEQPRIIALSSHIQQDDRDRFLSAGMDGYINKSVRLEELAATLLQCPSRASISLAEMPPSAASELLPEDEPGQQKPETPIDMQVLQHLQETIGKGEREKMAELISIFLNHTTGFFADLEQAIAQSNRETLRHIAHTLKSSSASLGATRLSRLCRALELSSTAGDMPRATEHAVAIASELRQVHTMLAQIRQTGIG